MAILSQHPKKLICLLLLFFGAAAGSYFAFWPTEPVCQGRPLSAWLQELIDLGLERPTVESDAPGLRDWEDRHQRAVKAIRSIGPKALPYLLKWLRVVPKASPFRDKLQELLQKQSFIKVTLPRQRYRGEQAIAGFEALGPIATPALPKLQELLLDPTYSEVAAASLYAIGPACLPVLAVASTNIDYRVQYHALQALVPLAPQVGAPSLPILLNAFTNVRCQYHREALLGLGDLGTQAQGATSLLEATVHDSSNPLRGLALRVLAEVNENPKQYLPIFADRLTNTNFTKDVAFALARVGFESLPPLLRALTNEDRIIKRAALAALRPEFRKRAGVAASDRRFSALSKSFDSQSSVAFLSRPDLEAETIALRLAELLKSSDLSVRLQVVQMLGQYGYYGALGLSRAAKDQEERVRSEAKVALTRLDFEVGDGAIVRGPQAKKKIALVFAAHEHSDSTETILHELGRHQAHASFFLTGDFLMKGAHKPMIQLIADGDHYLGPHSDKHLLCCSWEESKRTLLTREEFWADFQKNLTKLGQFVHLRRARFYFFLPPYARCNLDIVEWASDFFFLTIAPTPGTLSSADYASEGESRFVSSKAIFDSIVSREQQDPHGLNGFILLFHLGSGPSRPDKFHTRFGELLDYLTAKGYQFVSIDELFDPQAAQDARNRVETNPQSQEQFRKLSGLDH